LFVGRDEYLMEGVEGDSKEKKNVAGVGSTEKRFTDKVRRDMNSLAPFSKVGDPRAVSKCLF
jgi:hypothetical protein